MFLTPASYFVETEVLMPCQCDLLTRQKQQW
jgi:hypothetical protein